jgi:hypothetical protein
MVPAGPPTPSRMAAGGMPAAQAPLPVEAPPPQPQRSEPNVAEIPAPEDVPPPPQIVEFSTPAAKAIVKKSLAGVAVLLDGMGVKPESTQVELFSLSDNDLHPVVLDTLLTGFFGTEWHDWEHDTLIASLKDIEAEGGGVMSEQNQTKLLAMSALHSTTYPWMSLGPFSKCALALDNRIPDFGILEPVHPATILCALSVMRSVNPTAEFSHEVIRFMAASCVHDGVMIFPDAQQGDNVGIVIRRLVNKSVSEIDWDMMMSLWQRFVASGGGGEHEPDEVDESNLVDYQVGMASRIAAYAEDFEMRRVRQLSSLMGWIVQANRS